MNVLEEDYYASRTMADAGIKKRVDPVIYNYPLTEGMGPLNHTDLKRYEKEGYLFVENLFDRVEIVKLIEELEELKNASEKNAGENYIKESGSGAIRSIFSIHKMSKIYNSLAVHFLFLLILYC